MEWLIRKVHVNIPFTMLFKGYFDHFIRNRLNPEIGIDALALDTFSRQDFRMVSERFQEYAADITLHGPFLDLAPGSPDPEVRALTRKRFEQMLQLVPVFRPISVVCHAGYDWKRYEYLRDEWIERSLETWSWLAARLNDAGSRLVLENVYEHGPLEIRVLFEQLEPLNVGFCLDTGHQSAFSRTPLDVWLDVLGGYLGHLHLHDNDGRIDEHLAMGHGSIDFTPLLDFLKKNHRSRPVITLEPHTEENLWPSLSYLERAWPWETDAERKSS